MRRLALPIIGLILGVAVLALYERWYVHLSGPRVPMIIGTFGILMGTVGLWTTRGLPWSRPGLGVRLRSIGMPVSAGLTLMAGALGATAAAIGFGLATATCMGLGRWLLSRSA